MSFNFDRAPGAAPLQEKESAEHTIQLTEDVALRDRLKAKLDEYDAKLADQKPEDATQETLERNFLHYLLDEGSLDEDGVLEQTVRLAYPDRADDLDIHAAFLTVKSYNKGKI